MGDVRAGLGTGATEAVPIGHLFQRLEKASGGGFTRWLGIVGAQTGEEGLQEALQQLLQNAAERGLLDPNRDLTKDVAENFLVGAISGALVTGVMAAPAALQPSVEQVRERMPAPGRQNSQPSHRPHRPHRPLRPRRLRRRPDRPKLRLRPPNPPLSHKV